MRPRRVLPRAIALLLCFSFVGCPLLKKKRGDGDGTDAATVSVSGTGARNEADVLRYAQEEKVANEPATIGKDGTTPRTYPGLGQPVATLAKGTSVTKVAKYFSTGVLVLFDDATTPGQKLLGWVAPEELAAGAATATTAATTTTTTTAPKAVIAAKDAGVGVVDAGTAPSAAATGAPAAVLFTQPGADGKCPTGFAPAPGGCRRPCTNDASCPRGTFCNAAGLGRKFCSTSR